MLTVFVAETGVRLPLRSLSSVDGLNGLKQEIQTLSSIPISSQILLTDKGGQVKAELLSQALLDDGSEDLVVYVFNRLALNQASQSVLNGSMVEIEPPVPLEVLRLVSPFNERNGVSLQEQCSAYAYAFQSHTSFAVANWKTAQNHLQSCERLVQEQRVQAEALRIAVTNLQVHSKFAQKEFLKHAALLHSFPSDLQALHRIPVHPIIAKEEHRFLSDYVPEEKLMTWAESCKAAHDQLVKKTAVVAEQVRHIKTGTESELRHSLQIDFDKMDQQIRGVRDLLSQMGDRRRLIERDNGRVEATFRDSNNAIAMETISALHHLYEIHRNEYLQEIIHFDSVIRDQLTDIASSKLHLSYSLASRLQTISQLQSVIAAVSPQLSSLTSSLSSHEQAFAQLLHVHRMPPAWAACLVECVRRKEYVRFFLNKARDVAEVLAKFRRQEEKRRDNFKGEIVRYLPAKLVTGLDDKVPSWEIQVSNTKDNLPNITRNDLAEFEKLVNHLRAAMNDVDPSSSGLRGSQSSGGVHHNDSISKLQATLLKTLPQIDSLSSEFERILLKSGLSERASKLEEEVLKLRGHLSERSGGNLGSSPGTGDRGSISPSPTTTKRHLGGKAISAGTFDLRSVDPLELSRAEETIKAYEGRIKTLEGLLQRSYLQMSASRSTERTVTSDSPNISSPAVALPKPDAVKSAETVISTLTNENQSLQSKLESAESELTRLKLSMATLDSRHNLVLADRDRERAVGDAERHQLRLRCANLERELKESKNSITLREADLKALQSELERVAIFLREVHAQLDSCSLAMDTLAGRSTSLSNTIGRGPSPSIGIPLPTSRLTQTTGFSNSAPDGTPPLFNALSPRSPTMTSPIAITGSIGSGNTGISSSPTYPVLPSTVPSALILSLRSDEKEIRRRLRELEDDVRCQTLQLVGLQEEAGLGLHGEEVQEEDDEEDDEHVSQATSSADLELRSMGLSADAAAVPRLPTEPKLEEPTINALKEELLVAQSKVESLNMTVEKLHHFIENSEKTAAAAKTDYNAALSQIANLTENTDRVRLENSELLKKLKDMTGERVASDANNAAIMERS
ncbi:hypothetical protein DFJ73DRAFT_2669 [Zopfochytrium polystomum]|nr:hypothetical protein DFJ73DRAFT_2669 [Zopfochytrium polystomum]